MSIDKYNYLLIILCLVTGLNSQAQESKKGDWIIGVEAGVSYSNLSGINSSQHMLLVYPNNTAYSPSFFIDGRWGASLSLAVEYFIADGYSLRSGLQYENKGFDFLWNESLYYNDNSREYVESFKYTGDLVNNYLSVPLLFRKYFLSNKLYIEGGVYGAFNVKSELELELFQLIQPDMSQVVESGVIGDDIIASGFYFMDDTSDETNNFDYGVIAGAGLNLPLNDRLIFTAGFQLNYGLNDIGNHSNEMRLQSYSGNNPYVHIVDYYGFDSNSNNINLSLRVGLSYRIISK